MRRTLVAAIGAIALATGTLVAAGTARAANGTFSLFGDATLTSTGVQMTSTPAGTYGGVAYTPSGSLTLGGLTNLSTDFAATQGGCGGGSPRFSVEVQTPSSGVKSMFVYIGTAPSFSCSVGNTLQSTGNLLSLSSLDLRCDTSQLGGAFYQLCSQALATYGSYPVTEVALVVDAGWAFPPTGQAVVANNIRVNNDVFTVNGPPTDKDQCTNGGWQTFNFPRTFKNQGDCIQFVNTGK